MSFDLEPKIFGSPLRTRILVTTAMLGETYPWQLTRLLEAPLYSVQRIVDSLERERLIATRRRGKERIISLNPETAIAKELRTLLLRIANTNSEYLRIRESLRTRPRRRGKALEPEERETAALVRRLASRVK